MKKLIITKEELITEQLSYPLTYFTKDLIKYRKLLKAGFDLNKEVRIYEQLDNLTIVFEQDE